MSPRRTRVLWLAAGLGHDGAGRSLVNCARHADLSRFEIEVACCSPAPDALAAELERAGLRVHRLGGGEPDGTDRTDPRRTDRRNRTDRTGSRRTGSRWPWQLNGLLTERRYGLVHTHAPVPAVAARLLAFGRYAPRLVHTEHEVWDHRRTADRWANALTYRRNDAVIAVSPAVERSIPAGSRRAGDWVSVVHHGPDLAEVTVGPAARAAARAELGLPAGVVAIGLLDGGTPATEHRGLLAGYAELRRSGVSARLVLVGDGSPESGLRARAAELGLHDVVFAGPRPGGPALSAGLDVFALASPAQGLPDALLEAMAVGLPTVATRVGRIPEVLVDGAHGLLVPPGDPSAVRDALAALVADPALRERLGAASRERAARFDAVAAQRAVEALYRRVLRPRPGPAAAPRTAPHDVPDTPPPDALPPAGRPAKEM
ncbi:glycosyltransferase [Kitasatospora sp. NPDC057015]|uniref:glycosyltransferase n=1 Tax=Kitasatospora sp. NPDC057015 TaxID=3346001 RepID=UPI0036335EAB